MHRNGLAAVDLDLTWPVYWLQGREIAVWADLLGIGTFGFALWSYINPESSGARLGFALALLLCGGLTSSFGGINHFYHAWFWMAAVLVFLPEGQSRSAKLTYCLTFATAQGLLLTFYSLAGMWKLADGIESLYLGTEGNLSPRGLALTFADRILQTGTEPLLGRWFVEHWWLSLPVFAATIYMQLTAVLVVYRPRLHMAWGLALLGFHIGTFLFMEIIFVVNVMVIMVFLVGSPFQESNWLRLSTLRQLPLIGQLLSTFSPPPDRRLVPAE
jgi:hypothetical protein